MDHRIAKPGLLAALFALAACNGEEEAERVAPAEDSAPVLAEPEASIMRPGLTSEPEPNAVEDLPPEPLEETIPFGDGGTELSGQAIEVLREILQSEQLAEGWPLILRGHTDSVGDDEANLRISEQRASAVADWLVERGVDKERITIFALGEQRPIAPNANLDATPFQKGRARNRRVSITIAPPEEDLLQEQSLPE